MWRAELRKTSTTATTRWLWLIAVIVVVVGNYSTVASSEASDLTGPVRDQPFHIVAAVNLSLIALLVGVRSITDEYRHDTISWTMLTRPDRHTALVAKAAVAGLFGALIGLTAQLVGVGVAALTMNSRGGSLDLDLGDAAAIAGLTLAAAMLAIIGVAMGALIRNQLVAVATALVWMLAVENLGSALLGGLGSYLPGQAAYSLGVAGDTGPDPLVASIVLAAYVLLLLGAAMRDFDRRPVLHAG